MVYRLDVVAGNIDNNMWTRFCDHVERSIGKPYYTLPELRAIVKNEYNGIEIPESNFIDFETEEDAVTFKLKFS